MLFEYHHSAWPLCPLKEMTSHKDYASLRKPVPSTSQHAKYLRNAWSTEILLNLANTISTEVSLSKYACAWAPVQAYYAVYSGILAVSQLRKHLLSEHRGTLNFASNLVQTFGWVPEVCCYWCRGMNELGNLSYSPRTPLCLSPAFSNLRSPSTADEALALVLTCLKTTRYEYLGQRMADLRRQREKKSLRPAVTKAEKQTLDRNLPPTTLFDFLYRVRCRCNYQDTDLFIVGPETDGDSESFLNAITTVVNFALAFLETVVCAQIGNSEMESLIANYLADTRAIKEAVPVASRWSFA